MPREKEAYRDNLEGVLGFLREKYNDSRRVLNIKDVQTYTGRCYSYVKRNYFSDRQFISAETFARMLS